jgi:Lar family restriction alleviation protein
VYDYMLRYTGPPVAHAFAAYHAVISGQEAPPLWDVVSDPEPCEPVGTLPCPFCGEYPIVIPSYSSVVVECEECDVQIESNDRASAIASWNRRAP